MTIQINSTSRSIAGMIVDRRFFFPTQHAKKKLGQANRDFSPEQTTAGELRRSNQRTVDTIRTELVVSVLPCCVSVRLLCRGVHKSTTSCRGWLSTSREKTDLPETTTPRTAQHGARIFFPEKGTPDKSSLHGLHTTQLMGRSVDGEKT